MSTSKEKSRIDFDRILKHVGPLGVWQYLNLLVLFSVTLCAGIAVVTFAFAGYVPNYRCAILQCESVQNASYSGNDEDYVNLTLNALGYKVCTYRPVSRI